MPDRVALVVTLKQLRQLGLMILGFSAVMMLVAVALAELDEPTWVAIIVVCAMLLGYAGGMWAWSRSAVREGRAYYGQPHPSTTEPSPQRPSAREVIHEVGLPHIAFSRLGLLGLPSTLVGALTHTHWLLVVGLALLIVGLIDQSVVWPVRRARRSLSR